MSELKCNVDLVDSDEVYTLYDDKDKPVDFITIAVIEYGEDVYVLMQPSEVIEGIAEDEAVLFKLEEQDEENDLFLPVTDEVLLDKLFEEYLKKVSEAEAEEVEAK